MDSCTLSISDFSTLSKSGLMILVPLLRRASESPRVRISPFDVARVRVAVAFILLVIVLKVRLRMPLAGINPFVLSVLCSWSERVWDKFETSCAVSSPSAHAPSMTHIAHSDVSSDSHIPAESCPFWSNTLHPLVFIVGGSCL